MDGWDAWIGREAVRRQIADAESLRRFAVAIGASPGVAPDPPVLGHWAWFLDAPEEEGIGADGHPKRGGFMPPVALPRRMFASAAIRFERPVRLDFEAEMRSRILDVRERTGATGSLVFVDVERVLTQSGAICLTERQTIVYREAGAGEPLPTVTADVQGAWRPSELNLFRFSAATFNGHRIHYDRDYATGVEGYPDLVVQGPFTAARLAELARQDGVVAALEFRLSAPLYVNQPVRLHRTAPGTYTAARCDAVAAVTLKVEHR